MRPFIWLRPQYPWMVTDSNEVVEAMLGVALEAPAPPVLENRDVIRAAAWYRAR